MATSTTNLGLTKPAGTDKIRIAQINGNMDILDEKIGAVGNTSLQAQVTSQNEAIANNEGAMAYIVGNTNTTGSALAVGQFVYVKGHSTIAEGLYRVTASISANGSITTSNTSACSGGGLNALNANIANIEVPISGSYANQSAFETAMDSIISSMSVGEQKFVNVAFDTAWEPFGGSRFFGVLARETSNRWSGMFYSYSKDLILMANNVGTITYSKISGIDKIDITGTTINITAYDSLSNLYTCPSDGYVRVGGVNESVVVANQAGTTDVTMATANGTSLSIFVRKGMKVYISNPSYARFISLQ